MNDEHDDGPVFKSADWARLRELRECFLRAEQGAAINDPYWNDRHDFELYEATFAQRIGWKWDAVLRELELRNVLPHGAIVCDWGCGTGIAARRYLASSAGAGVKRVYLADRSKQVTLFAREALRAERQGLDVVVHPPQDQAPDVLLVSHVRDELDEEGLGILRGLIRRSGTVIWVEAGAQKTSRKLSAEREVLLEVCDVLAPCTHRSTCGVLAKEGDWCHFFAKAPAHVFTSAFWRKFSDEMGLDLRSLPYSFIVLKRRNEQAPPVGGGSRILGRPRMLKGRARLDACSAEGVRELSLLERTDRSLFKRLDRSAGEVLLFDVVEEAGRISALRSLVE
jgi:hypothetical protein